MVSRSLRVHNLGPMAYFALSLLWRGAAHKWKTLKDQTTSVELGEYEEPIRRYLLGETGIPDGVYVVVAVCTDRGSQVTNYVPSKVRGGKYRHFSILTRGIWFDIFTDAAAGEISKLCCVRSERKVIHLTNCHKRFVHAGRHIHRTAKVAANLA